MKFTAQQIAQVLEGVVEGDPTIEVSKLSKIEEATKGSLTFLANPKYESFIYSTKASITIVNNTFKPEKTIDSTLIRVEDAYQAFTLILEHYNKVKLLKTGIESPAHIGENTHYGQDFYLGAFSYIGDHVKIGNHVKIFPNCYIGDHTEIKDNTVIYPGVKVYDQSKIGSNCVIHSGVIIGSDGFGFAPNEDGSFKKIPQTGNVIVSDYVEIGASTTIDRATLGSTKIGVGVKLDNHIQIAHNVEIGDHTVIASQTGVAGSTKIGKHCMIGGQVGIVGHITIGDRVRIQAQSGVGKNIADGMAIQGSPAFNYSDFSKSYVHFRNLPKIVKELNNLKLNNNI